MTPNYVECETMTNTSSIGSEQAFHTDSRNHWWLADTLCKKASNRHANLPLEMYSFTFKCNHLGNTWKPLVLMTRHFDYCPSASEVRSSAPVVSRCFPGGYNVKLYISRGRLAWWLLAFLCCDISCVVSPCCYPMNDSDNSFCDQQPAQHHQLTTARARRTSKHPRIQIWHTRHMSTQPRAQSSVSNASWISRKLTIDFFFPFICSFILSIYFIWIRS